MHVWNQCIVTVGKQLLMLMIRSSVTKSIVVSTQEITLKLSWTDYVSKYVAEDIQMIGEPGIFHLSHTESLKTLFFPYKHFLRTMTNVRLKMIKHIGKQGTKSENQQKR